MAAQAFKPEVLAETVRRVEECLEEGFTPPHSPSQNSAISEAARRALADGFVRSDATFVTRLRSARRAGLEPDWSLWRAPVYQKPALILPGNDNYPISGALKPESKGKRVAVIGDAHDDPRFPDKSRFTWMGKWCAEYKPDYIVQLGDWATFDSMEKHSKEGSLGARIHPTYKQDIDSLRGSLTAFHKGLGITELSPLEGLFPKLIMTAGNHEYRVARYENSNPDLVDTLVPQWEEEFTSRGWRVVPYMEYAFIEGVGFIHHPVNGMGKAYGGKTGNQRAGNDTLFSIVHGHDHKLERVSSSKIGPTTSVEIISAGCSLPWGWVETYAKHSPAGWWWGVIEMTVNAGQITDMNTISMLTLEERYGD